MDSPQPPDFGRLIADLSRELTTRGIGFMLIGGQAVLLHGIARLTEDIDVTLGVGPESLPVVLEVCRALALEPLPGDVTAFVRETFVLPARHPGSGVRVDLIFSTTAYEQEAIARALRVKVSGADVPFATAEDLLIHKMFAGRPRDLEDALGMVRRKHGELDWNYLQHWTRVFATVPGREGMPEMLQCLRDDEWGTGTGKHPGP